MFPRALMERFPLLPLEEEGRLNDMPLRENFIERVFEQISVEICLDLWGHEEGMDDEIRFSIRESGPKEFRLFAADETSFLFNAPLLSLDRGLLQAAQQAGARVVEVG